MATIVYRTMAPGAQDPLQELLVKAAYYLQAVAEGSTVTSASAMYTNMTPFAQDSVHDLVAKLAYWASQIAGSGGGGSGGNPATSGNYGGVAPPTDGSIPKYFAYDTSTGFLWYNSGTIASPTWNNV